jgi:hypothetical protein
VQPLVPARLAAAFVAALAVALVVAEVVDLLLHPRSLRPVDPFRNSKALVPLQVLVVHPNPVLSGHHRIHILGNPSHSSCVHPLVRHLAEPVVVLVAVVVAVVAVVAVVVAADSPTRPLVPPVVPAVEPA